MKPNQISALLVLLFIVIASAPASAAGPDESVNPGLISLESIASSPKLSNDTQMLNPFESGSATISVVVSLRHSTAARELSARSLEMSGVQSNTAASNSSAVNGPFYNLSNADIRTQLASAVETELDSFLVGIESFNGANISANNTSAIAPITVTNQFKYSFGIAANVTLAGLDYLLQSDKVLLVEENLILTQHMTQGIGVMNGTATRVTFKGAGVAVAIVDTGIDDSHPDLNGGKVLGGYDFGDDDTNFRPTVTGSAHGTSVGGIVAGDVNAVDDYIGGVAPDAKLYGLKISPGDSGSASSADMVDAWEWAITHQNDDPNNPILVVNTSFGGGRYTASCNATNSAMTQAALNGVNAGITHFVSSGNDGFCDAMGWPACITHVNSVGAVYDANIGTPGWCVSTDSCLATSPNPGCGAGTEAFFESSTTDDQVTAYSNSDTNLTIFAPSNNAYTTTIVGTGNSPTNSNYTTSFGGTSAAAPYSSGAAAVLQSAAKVKMGRFLTPAEVQQYFLNNGQSITDSKASLTKPRVDLGASVGALPTLVWDLIVESPSVSDNTVTIGQSFNINATVRNQGTGTSPSSTLRYFVSTNNFISTGDLELTTDPVASLASGATSPESASVSISTAGTVWVGACVDTAVGESVSNNQCSAAVEVTVSELLADLIVESPSVNDNTVTAGQSVGISATVRNQGAGASPSSTLRYFISTDDIISTGDVELTTDPVASLASGATSPESASVPISTIGTFWVGACVDPVAGESLTNNQCSDAVQVVVSPPSLTLSINAASISEAGGSTTATVLRNTDTVSSLTVTLSSNDTSEATVPPTIIIAAGQSTSAAFTITGVDDAIVDGTQTVSITALAAAHTSATQTLDVTDNDAGELALSISAASISEAGGSTTATVSRNTNTASGLTVALSSNDTTEATVPASITIAAGQNTSAAFTITGVDDAIVDGTQTVSITALAAALTSATQTLDVTDNDTAEITMIIAAESISEGDGPIATFATVSRNTDTSSALTVTLVSDDTTEAIIPASSVSITAGQSTSSAFNIDAVDDTLIDGTQTVTLTASATAHADGTDTLDVTDDDVPGLTVVIAADSVSEDAGPGATTATVTRNTDTSSALTVTLVSDDTTEATVPISVTIAAGQSTSTPFDIDAIPDVLVDGTQTVTVTASAALHADGTDTLDVTDTTVVSDDDESSIFVVPLPSGATVIINL